MVTDSFDIFKLTGTAEPRWIEAVATLLQARTRVDALIEHQQSEYLIFNQSNGEEILVTCRTEAKRILGKM